MTEENINDEVESCGFCEEINCHGECLDSTDSTPYIETGDDE
jgi:hypothetical protein